jgi:hypothetical protein
VNEAGLYLHFSLDDIANKQGALWRQATGPTRIRGRLCSFVSLHGYSTETGIFSYAFVIRVLWILLSAFFLSPMSAESSYHRVRALGNEIPANLPARVFIGHCKLLIVDADRYGDILDGRDLEIVLVSFNRFVG